MLSSRRHSIWTPSSVVWFISRSLRFHQRRGGNARTSQRSGSMIPWLSGWFVDFGKLGSSGWYPYIQADSSPAASGIETARLLVYIKSQSERFLFFFLGLELDSIGNLAWLSYWGIATFNRCLSLFQLHHIICLCQCQQLLGVMASVIPAMPPGLLMTRKCQIIIR